MKKTKHFQFFVVALAVVVLAGCRKKDSDAVTGDDAADVVSYALETTSGGLAEQVDEAANYAYTEGYGKTSTITCGVPFDTTVTYTHTGLVTASYSHTFSYLLTCTGANVPQSLAYTGTYNGSYETSRMQSSNAGSRNLVLTGLQPQSASYTLNGAFTRTGSHTSKVRNQNTFDTNVTINITSVTVDKSTMKITGGTGTADVTCEVSNGNSYSFTGSLVFNGNGTATLTINGTDYTITLY